jgi:tripartite-type tricarboxylate transporter receptor subunit TctC
VAGFKAESIRYKGNAPGITAIIAGEAHYTFASLGVVKGFVDAGRGRILATSGVKRSAVLPELPTIAETIAPGFDYLYWTALFAPAGLPPAIFNPIYSAASQAIREPDVVKRLLELGYEAAGGGPEDVMKLMVSDHAKWKRVKEETGIKAED